MGINTLTFDSVNTGDYGIYISGSSAFNASGRVYDMQVIPGRNGELAIDGGRFENIEVKYPAFIFGDSEKTFSEKMAAIRNEFASRKGYKRLSDTYNPDEFRQGIYRGGLDAEPKHYNRAGEFDLVFYCKPQRYLVSGEAAVYFDGDGSIHNPTMFDAKPLIAVTGSGTVGIGSYSMTITGTPNQTIYIDCEIMEAWEQSGTAIIPRNDYVQRASNEILLKPGVNGIGLGSGITGISIVPRWWII